jgi:hypothetical protein
MQTDGNLGGTLSFHPNSTGVWENQPDFAEPPMPIDGDGAHWDHRVDDDHWEQPGNLFRKMTLAQRQVLFENTAGAMGDAALHIKQRHMVNCMRADPSYLHSVIMRDPRDAPDKSTRGNQNRIVRIKVGAAVNPPRSGEYEREAIGGVGVRSAHVPWVPLHQDKIRPGLVQATIERRHLAAVRWKAIYPAAPPDRVGKCNLGFGQRDCARQREWQGGKQRQELSTRRTDPVMGKEDVRTQNLVRDITVVHLDLLSSDRPLDVANVGSAR